jgi:uncharacterized protein YcsI (UPF0317 family)
MANNSQLTNPAPTPDVGYHDLRRASADAVRDAIRNGAYRGHTAGLAAGRLQCNLVILPERHAVDFMRFCQRNPKPCPLVGVSETGDPMMHTLGCDIDIRTDIPGYNIYRGGVLAEQAADIREIWQGDMVAFALGCSFTFERALIQADIPLRHIERNQTVPMYRTTVQTERAGPFGGGLVVSMRPLRDEDVEKARRISRRYPLAHGAPVHVGCPGAIGIDDIGKPDWGDASEILRGETPVFWACGVTPQNAVTAAGLPLCITHTPGHMLITDIDELAEVPVYHADQDSTPNQPSQQESKP